MGVIHYSFLHKRRLLIIPINLFLILALATGCGIASTTSTQVATKLTPSPSGQTATPSPTPISETIVTFNVTIPVSGENEIAGPSVYIDILDEVTGLGLNPTRYQMESSGSHQFSIKLPIMLGAIVKYRYIRDSQYVEYTTAAQQVRYRVLAVSNPTTVQDIVSGWLDTPYQGATGRIGGIIVDASDNAPLPDVLVCAGGHQALTASDGSFIIVGLPAGTHNLVAMTLDGLYHPFQQGAKVAADSFTPVDLHLEPAKMVSLTFVVTLSNEITGVPVRLAGDLYSLGDTFADLEGGVNTTASRMPVLSPLPDGRLTIKLQLPAGTDLHYTYTLGDGFWNAEHTQDGKFNVREMIVPDQDALIEDTIATWKSGTAPAITFSVSVPANTPASDNVSIQFNPYGWMESIPMWAVGNGKWIYILYSPLNMVQSFSYRYCRNDQCNIADDSETQGVDASGWQVKQSAVPQSFNDVVSQWAWWQPSTNPTTVASVQITPRSDAYIAGVEFQNGYQPSWQSKYLTVFQDLKRIGSGWVFLTPTWTYRDNKSAIIGPVAGANPLWGDLLQTINQADSSGLNVAVFPQPRLSLPVDLWWQSAPRDFSWWVTWFESYKTFLINFADLSTKTQAKALVIGGDWLMPALPGGKLVDGSPSGVPSDALARWKDLIEQIRTHYKGTLIWALPFTKNLIDIPGFISDVDQVYVLFSLPVSNASSPIEKELEGNFGSFFDSNLAPLQQSIGKPIILGVSYASILGSASSCVALNDPKCINPIAISQPGLDSQLVTLDLQAQLDVYNALMVVVNQRDWINGFISRGYYPPAALQDKSFSIHGKPAFDVLWYWFSRLRGTQ
jgi:hypothetical protein